MIKSKYFEIDQSKPTYFIADIAANHDGDLNRALKLIELAAESGANAAKFQHFQANTIVSRKGFEVDLEKKIAHQAKWNRSVWQVYKDAELPLEWTEALIRKCDEVKIDFFTAPYNLEAINHFAKSIPFFKIGSGDINYLAAIEEMIKWKKPIFLATGASTLHEVQRTVDLILGEGSEIVLMQCNTNYTGESNNLKYINLNVLKQYSEIYPNLILGLSDHTKGDTTVLGAIALGARVIEKHFTDNETREGPDHAFSINPHDWSTMVKRARELESSLGDGKKKVELNELDSRIVQRRALRTARDLVAGQTLLESDLVALRPMPAEGIEPFRINEVLGRKINKSLESDSLLTFEDLE